MGLGTGLICFLTNHIKPRTLIVLIITCVSCSLIVISFAKTFFQICVLSCIMGFCAGCYLTPALSTLSELVKDKIWNKAVALHELAPPLGMLGSPLIAELMIGHGGNWRSVLLTIGIFGLCCAILFAICAKGGHGKSDAPSIHGIDAAFKTPAFWLFLWCFALAAAAEVAPYNVISLQLTSERGLTTEAANKLLAMTRIISPFGVIFGGFITTRLGTRKTMMIFFIAHAASLLLMSAPNFYISVAGMFLQPFMPAFAFTAVFSILYYNFKPPQFPLLMALSIPAAYIIGIGLVPKMFGFCGDHFNFATGFIILAIINIGTLPFCKKLNF